MIESVMVFALGFFAASLGALLILPALSRRAERLARRRVEARLPLSLAEFAAERDLLRAEMAVETRKIEMKAEKVAQGKAEDMAELGRRAVSIHEIQNKLAATSADLERTQQDLDAIRTELAQRSLELEQTRAELQEKSLSLAEKRDALARLEADHAKLAHVADERRIGMVALETALQGQRAQLAERERELSSAKIMLDDTGKALADTRIEVAMATHRLALADEAAGAREAALNELRAERDRIETERARLQTQTEADAAAIAAEHAVNAQIDAALDALKAEFSAISNDYAMSLDHLRSEKAAVTGALEAARQDRDRLDKELKAARKQAKSAADRNDEDALLRREIHRVADDVLRLVSEVPPAPSSPTRKADGRRRGAKAPLKTSSLPADASAKAPGAADLPPLGDAAAAVSAAGRSDIGGIG